MRKKREPGRRLCVWIPESEHWMFRTIERLRKLAETRGIPLTQGDVARLALSEYLRDSVTDEDCEVTDTPKVRRRGSPLGSRRMIVFRKSDAWLLEQIDRIVDTKLQAGIRTSFSYEVTRLMKIGLARSLDGSELDRKIIKPHVDDSKGEHS